MDLTQCFFLSDLNKEIYVVHPEYFNYGTDRICKLQPAMCELKQAGCQRNLTLGKARNSF